MRRQSVTIKSLAESLGISFSTVAKALNNDPNISEKTRLLVQKAAAAQHYTPNEYARGLRQRESKTVAAVLNDLDVPAYSAMLATISSELAVYGFTTLLADTQYNPEREETCLKSVMGRMPQAVIVSPADPNSGSLRSLQAISSNTLVLGTIDEDSEMSSIAVDHTLAGFLSADYMLSCGNRNMVVFAGPDGYQSADLYLSGVREACRKHGVVLPDEAVYRFRPDEQTAMRLFSELYRKNPAACEGVVCFCDSMAFGIYRAARELGLTVGQDVSVIGYDDNPTNDFTAPPLTTVHMPKDLIAKHCTQFMLHRLLNGDTEKHTYRLEPFLVERSSVRKK